MCGIAGLCHIDGPDGISLNLLKRMIGVLSHRGPDETGLYLDNHVGLGHARLSIIDLSSGGQPIHNEDESLWIIYNGEVFNYVELKKELEQKGHRFYTTTDTEVILHLYEEEGPECVTRLNGQFGMAIWDANAKSLFLARDRVGIRPLFYTVLDNTLYFGSEIKSIFMNPNIPRRIDPVAMDQIFTFWTTLATRTVFENIYELPPGHYLTVSEGEVTIEKYWDIPLYSPADHVDWTPEEISREIQRLLLEAIRLRLRADVPIGCYLSGGLDSSGITTLVVKNFNSHVRTFGIRFEENAFDEGDYQRQMVSYLNVDHTEVVATNEDIGTALGDCLWHCERPLLRTGPIPLYLLSRIVRQSNFKVVLTGEGADEVFGGYNIFREAKIRRFWAQAPDSQHRARLVGQLYPYIFNNPRFKHTLQSFFSKGLDRVDDPLFSHMIRWENTSKIKNFFSSDLRHAIGLYCGYEQVKESLPAAYEEADYLARAQYLETAIFLSGYLLSSQGDRMAMAHSVEIRLPFLDPSVMEFMGRVPAKWKILGLNEKHILKRTFKGILPEAILRRPKNPYRAPIKQSLLNQKMMDDTYEALSETSLRNAGLFDAGKVAKLLRKMKASDRASEIDDMALMGILSSQLVYQRFVENFPVRPAGDVCPDLVVDYRSEALKPVQ